MNSQKDYIIMANRHQPMLQIRRIIMEREIYVSPETEIIVFETEDVMMISGPEDVFNN